jgi:hypothetical protein
MRKPITTFFSDIQKDYYATVVVHIKEDSNLYCIEYFNDKNELFYIEEFPNNSIQYVQDAAENWCMGIKKLEI